MFFAVTDSLDMAQGVFLFDLDVNVMQLWVSCWARLESRAALKAWGTTPMVSHYRQVNQARSKSEIWEEPAFQEAAPAYKQDVSGVIGEAWGSESCLLWKEPSPWGKFYVWRVSVGVWHNDQSGWENWAGRIFWKWRGHWQNAHYFKTNKKESP